jgi:hypothetical protein
MTSLSATRVIVEVMFGRTLKAVAILAVGLVGGAVFWATDHWLIGLILICAAIPVALTAWIVADD